MSPTRAEIADGRLVLRVNPMQGPRQRPLRPGTWEVVAERGNEIRPLFAAGEPVAGWGAAEARFAITRRRDYVVAPTVDPLGVLVLVVRFEFRAPPVESSMPSVDDAAQAERGLETEGNVEAAEAELQRHERRRARRRFRPLRRPTGRLRTLLFRFAFRTFRVIARRNGRRILFTSDSREGLSDNLKLVHDRMVERGLDRYYEFMHLFKPGIRARRSWWDRLRLPWLLARADVILVDDYQPVIYRLRDAGSKIIQLWHAYGSFKTVGYSRVGKPGGLNPWSRVHKNYTYAIVGSRNDVPHYAEAFGIPEERVIPTGVPRMDAFVEQSRDTARRERALAEFPEARGRRAILFAPTFRGHGARSAHYPVHMIDFAALHRLCVEKDAVFIIRLHPFVRDPLDIPAELADRIIDGSGRPVETNDLLLITDVLVTDYSSVIYEFSLLGRPMLFYAYDLEEYVASRDFYTPYEEFVPGRIVRSFDELVDALRRDDYEAEKLGPFVERHFDHLDGKSADRIIDELILDARP